MKRLEQRYRKIILDFIKGIEIDMRYRSYDVGQFLLSPSSDRTFVSVFDNMDYMVKPKLLFSVDLEKDRFFSKPDFCILKRLVQEIKKVES